MQNEVLRLGLFFYIAGLAACVALLLMAAVVHAQAVAGTEQADAGTAADGQFLRTRRILYDVMKGGVKK